MKRATEKQIRFIEKLMKTREIGELADSVEAQSVNAGMGDELSSWQASRFIDLLLQCPLDPDARPSESYPLATGPACISVGTRVHHKAFGDGEVITADDRTATVRFGSCDVGIKKMLPSYLTIS